MDAYMKFVLVAVLLYICIAPQLSRIHAQNQRIEFGLRKLLAHHGIELWKAVEPSEQVKMLARTKGAEIDAIKAYREQTGLGLREARAVVQGLAHTSASDQ
jgi:ribosomal protein L7/L12